MPCDRCPSTAVFSAMGVRFCPLSKRAAIPAALPAQKGLPARLRCVLRVRENPAGPWTGHPSCYSAASSDRTICQFNPASAAPTANMPINSGLNSRLLPAPGTPHRQRICRDLTPNANSIQQEGRKSGRATLTTPWPCGPQHAGSDQVGRIGNVKGRLAEEECLRRGSGSEGFGSGIGSAARCERREKESPFPSKPKGRGQILSREGRIAVRRSFEHYPGLATTINEGVVDQGVARPDQHLDRDRAG